MNGSPVLHAMDGSSRSVLEAYLGRSGAGGAVADLLFGEVNPAAS